MAGEQQPPQPSSSGTKRRKSRRRSSSSSSKSKPSPAPVKKQAGPIGWVKANPKPSAGVAVVALVLVLVFARPDAETEPLEDTATDDIFAELDALDKSQPRSADSAEGQPDNGAGSQQQVPPFEGNDFTQESPPFDQQREFATYNPGASIPEPAWGTSPQPTVVQPQLTLPGTVNEQIPGSPLTPIQPIGFTQPEQPQAVWLTGTIELDEHELDTPPRSLFSAAQPLPIPRQTAELIPDSRPIATSPMTRADQHGLPVVTPGEPANKRAPAGLPIINPGRSRATGNQFASTNNDEPVTATARY